MMSQERGRAAPRSEETCTVAEAGLGGCAAPRVAAPRVAAAHACLLGHASLYGHARLLGSASDVDG